MKSPFPGMDPFLERHWGDVHQAVVTYIRDSLQSRLPADLRAHARACLHRATGLASGGILPGCAHRRAPRHASKSGSATALAEPEKTTEIDNGELVPAEPILIHVDIEPITENFIEIIDVKSGHRVVTAIEVLSPTNKRPTEGQRLYLKKRNDLKLAGVNTVEIDLLRDGERVLMVPQELVPPTHRTAYQVCIWRAVQPDTFAVYPIAIRERLPVISIPLRPNDREVPLSLQAILDLCYRNGGYDDIDYRSEPDPALAAEEAKWADGVLREHGRR